MHRLEGFYWVATAGGYTAAARAFPYPISQPAVYQQVRKLEEDLDTTLFERVSRDRVELTAAGRRLHEFCAPFFEQLPSVVREIEGKSFGGVLRIEAAPLEIRHVLPPFIQRLRAQRPDIELQLAEVQTPDPLRVLVSQTDFVVDYLPRIPHGVSALEIARHHAFLITPSAWGKPSARRPAAILRGRPFVSYERGLFQHQMQLAGLRALGVEPERKLSVSSTEALLGFVAAGLGYSLIPWPSMKGPALREVHATRLRGPSASFPIHAAYRTRKQLDPLVSAALQALTSKRGR